MKPTLYIESSVISYYTSRPSRDLIAAGHQQITQQWWRQQLSRCEPHISEVVREELSRGDPEAVRLRLQAVGAVALRIITRDAATRARKY